MQTENLISTGEFCKQYNVEYSFITSLQEYGLIEITTVENTEFFDANHLTEIEKYTRLHQDLEINLEGIEAITYLLERLKSMQDEITILRNKLSIYESIAGLSDETGQFV